MAHPHESRSRRRWLAGLALASLATHAAAQTDAYPQWVQDAMAIESEPLQANTLRFQEQGYATELLGANITRESIDDGWYLTAEIAEDTVVECYLMTTPRDLATLTAALADENVAAMAAAHSTPAGQRQLAQLDSGALGQAAYLSLEWLYTVGDEAEPLLAATKVATASNGDTTHACVLNQVGYPKTFKQLFEHFVGATEAPAADPGIYYQEVAQLRIDEQPIGVMHYTYRRDEDGDTLIIGTSASMAPIGPGSIAYEDTTSYTWSTPAGEVISASQAIVQNGEQVTDLELRRAPDDSWQLSGRFQSKQITAVIDGDSAPLSELGQMQLARALFAGEATKAAFTAWAPEADPTRFISGTLRQTASAGVMQGTISAGPIEMDARFDQYGGVESAAMEMGPNTLYIERLWSRGSPD